MACNKMKIRQLRLSEDHRKSQEMVKRIDMSLIFLEVEGSDRLVLINRKYNI